MILFIVFSINVSYHEKAVFLLDHLKYLANLLTASLHSLQSKSLQLQKKRAPKPV